MKCVLQFQLNSYGGNLQYFVYFVPTKDGEETSIPDVIIEVG